MISFLKLLKLLVLSLAFLMTSGVMQITNACQSNHSNNTLQTRGTWSLVAKSTSKNAVTLKQKNVSFNKAIPLMSSAKTTKTECPCCSGSTANCHACCPNLLVKFHPTNISNFVVNHVNKKLQPIYRDGIFSSSTFMSAIFRPPISLSC